mgnify:CR=1 FL=1
MIVSKYYATIELLLRILGIRFPELLLITVQDSEHGPILVQCNSLPSVTSQTNQILLIQKVTWNRDVVERYLSDCHCIIDIESVGLASLVDYASLYHHRKHFTRFRTDDGLRPEEEAIGSKWLRHLVSKMKTSGENVLQFDGPSHSRGSLQQSDMLIEESDLNGLSAQPIGQSVMDHQTYDEYALEQITVVASDHLIQDVELVNQLESQYNMKVAERDTAFFSQPDLAIGYRDCILVVEVPSGAGLDSMLHRLVTKLLHLRLQYSTCWLLVRNLERATSQYVSTVHAHHVSTIFEHNLIINSLTAH